MENEVVKTYYKVVWNTDLNTNLVVEGEEITKESKLPKEEMSRYGTHDNDVAVVRVNVIKERKKYDWLTTKQTVEVYTEQEKYKIKRDLRIIIWDGEPRISLLDNYKVITPQFFEEIVKIKGVGGGGTEDNTIKILPSVIPVANKVEILEEIS